MAADLSGADGCSALIQAVPDLDVLVNNVGIFEPKPFEEIGDADWLRFFEHQRHERRAPVASLSQGHARARLGPDRLHLRRIGAADPTEMIHYVMTKTAQLAIARGIAETTAGTGVTVNSVLPGPTRSEGVATFVERMRAAARDRLRDHGA